MVEQVREREIHDIHHSDSGSGWAIAAVVIIAVILFLIFGLPALRGVDNSGTNVNIPDSIDVNVNDVPTPGAE
jgi:hypothetical protein